MPSLNLYNIKCLLNETKTVEDIDDLIGKALDFIGCADAYCGTINIQKLIELMNFVEDLDKHEESPEVSQVLQILNSAIKKLAIIKGV